MNQEEANRAIDKTGTLLCIDVPEGTEFGIDCYSCTAGPLFRGIKLIPYGIHIIFFSVPNPHGGEGSSRVSFFVNFSPKQKILVKQWNPREEDFYNEAELDQDHIERLKLGVQNFDFDRGLGAYPVHLHQEWITLSSLITPRTIHRIQSSDERLVANSKPLTRSERTAFNKAMKDAATVTEPSKEEPKEPKEESKAESKDKFAEGTPMDEEDELAEYRAASKFKPSEDIPSTHNYAKVSMSLWNPSMSPQDITLLNFDKSTIIKNVIEQIGSQDELLAELQFAFVSFLIAQSYEGFEHWKKLVELICRCQSLIEDTLWNPFYLKFVIVLKCQIELVPEDFFSDIIGGNNFLLQTLKEFFEIQPAALSSQLAGLISEFKQQIEKRFGTSFDIEDYEQYENEDGPVLVEIEDMKALGLTPLEIQKILSS